MTGWLIALSVIGPLFVGTGTARAGDSDLAHDARLESYGARTVALDTGPAMYFLLFGTLAVLGLSVMFKDAKRSDVK